MIVSRLQQSINDLTLKCRICKRTLIEPRVLPCLHTFCTKCLFPLIKRKLKEIQSMNGSHTQGNTNTAAHDACNLRGKHLNRSHSCNSCNEDEIIVCPEDKQEQYISVIKCPVCESESTVLDDGVLDLPLNYIVQNRMVAAFNHSSVCTQCTEDVPATVLCLDCQYTMCTFCSDVHQQKKGNMLHEINSLQDILSGSMLNHNQVMCRTHQKRELRLFCTLCNILVCRDCCMEQHHTHPCETAAKVARQYKLSLKEALIKSQPLAKETVLSLSRLQNLQHRIQVRCREVEREIETFAVTYKLAVEEHCQVLLREVAQVRQNKLAALKAYEQLVHVRSEQSNQAVTFSQDVLNEASDIEMLSVVNILMNRLNWCQETPPVPASKISDCIIFLPEERASVINKHPMCGVVTTQSVSPHHCILETDGLLNCHQYKRAEFIMKTCDSDGQQLCHGGEKINAELHYMDATQRQVPTKVLDKGDGSYILIFTPDAPGNLSLTVKVQLKNIKGSPFNVSVSTQKPHPGIYHCCTFCSSNGNKNISCACGSMMPGYNGCGHGHDGHPGQRHWSCCGSLLHNSECTRNQAA